jgi:hypothetical protein
MRLKSLLETEFYCWSMHQEMPCSQLTTVVIKLSVEGTWHNDGIGQGKCDYNCSRGTEERSSYTVLSDVC